MGQRAAGLSPRKAGFNPGLVYVRFVDDKVALRQISLRILRPFSGTFQQCSALIFTLNTIHTRRTSGSSLEKFEHSNDIWDITVHCKKQYLSQCGSNREFIRQ
jgi:hypothetical protein